MPSKKIFVKFGSIKSPTQIKCIMLPENGEDPEVVTLRRMLYKELLADSSIISLGGSKSTSINDIHLLRYDSDYEELIDVSLSTIFDDKEKNVMVKLHQTDIQASQQLPDNINCVAGIGTGIPQMSQDALDESNTNTFNKFLNPSSTANHDPSTAADKETVKHSLKLDDSIAEEDLEMGNRATLGCSSSSTDFLTDSDPPFSNGQKIRSPPIKKARKLTSQLPAVKAGVDLLQNTTPLAIGQLMEAECVDLDGPQVVEQTAAVINNLATQQSVPVDEKVNHQRQLPTQSVPAVEATISLPSEGQAMFKLLSIYYVFDRNYPAITYGLLLLLDRYCVSPKGTPAAARGARKGDPLNFRKFVNGFEKFLTDFAESE